jgi:hypothetical protein
MENPMSDNRPPSRFRYLTRFLVGTAIIAAVFWAGYTYIVRQSSCRRPVTYTIGSVDERFKISSREFEATTQAAVDRWDQATDRRLFQEESNAALKVNLVYDQRQAELDKLKSGSSALAQSKTGIAGTKESLDAQVQAFNGRARSYAQQVAYWNSRGGAPPDQYQALEKEKQSLSAEQSRLESLAESFNSQVDLYNTNVESFNEEVEQSNNKIITQGEYSSDGPAINIYTFGDQDELRLVLMHELGHALGLDHVAGEKSIMYYFLNAQDLENPVPLQEDLDALTQHCQFPNDFIGGLKNLYWRIVKQKQT